MARIVSLLLGAAVVWGTAYGALKWATRVNSPVPVQPGQSNASAPKQQVEHFEQKARGIERDTQQRIDDLYKRTQ